MMIKSLHRYLGLFLCLLILSISLTGVILVWKKEYLWLTIDAAREPLNTQLLAKAIERIEASYDDDELIFIQLYSEDLSIHKIFLSNKRYAWHDQRGEQIQQWSGNQRFEDFLLDLHHRFLLGNTVGLNIAGFTGLLLMPLLILGLIIWWPRRKFLSLGLFPSARVTRQDKGPKWRRLALLLSHGNLGGVFALPVFLFGLTGVILVYPVESRFVLLEAFGVDNSPVTIERHYNAKSNYSNWQDLITIARASFPESKIRSIQPSSTESSKRVINLQQKRGWHRLGRTSLRFHQNGDLLVVDELLQAMPKRVFGFSYPLHTAKLGLLYRLAATLLGLALSIICVFGVLSYLQRKQSRIAS